MYSSEIDESRCSAANWNPIIKTDPMKEWADPSSSSVAHGPHFLLIGDFFLSAQHGFVSVPFNEAQSIRKINGRD